MYMYAALAEVEQFAVVTTAQPLVVNMYWEYPDTDVDSFTIIQCLKTSSHHCSVGGSVVLSLVLSTAARKFAYTSYVFNDDVAITEVTHHDTFIWLLSLLVYSLYSYSLLLFHHIIIHVYSILSNRLDQLISLCPERRETSR